MENASKALIIAGSIILAIMIISLSVFLFNKFKDSTENSVNMTEAEINAFNSKITPYFGDAVQGSKVNSLLQYCLSVNMSAQNSGDTNKCLTVKDNSGTVMIGPTSTSYTRVSTGNNYYSIKCTNYNKGMINEITITKN